MPRGGIEKPIGYETIWKDREGRIRTKVKTADHKFVDKRVAVWLKYHPDDDLKGYCILHLDGNTLNFDINNLVKVKKEVFLLMLNHHLYFRDSELNKSSILIAETFYENNKANKEVLNAKKN